MTIPTISTTIPTLPSSPSTADSGAIFDAKAFALFDSAASNAMPAVIAAVNTLTTELNTGVVPQINTATSSATTAATTATTKAAEAVSSAAAAATAATEAALLTEAYQGVHASNPTTDKHGNALTAGDWYSNSVTGATMVFNSLGQWVTNTNAGVSSINGQTGPVSLKTINNSEITGEGNLNILGVSSEFEEFLTSGTWTKPEGVTWVYVEAVGAGGSGGVSIAVNDAATPMSGVSTGGGGGRFVSRLFKAASLSPTVTVTVGAGGASKSLTKAVGSASSSALSGNSGGASSFGALVVASGGGNGNAATHVTSGSGPALVAGGASGGGCKNGIGGGFDSASAVGYGTQAPLGSLVQNGTNRGGGAGGTTIASGNVGLSGGQSLFDGSGSDAVSGGGQSSAGGLGGGGSGGVSASVATATAVTVTSGAGGNGYVRIYCW